MVGNFQAEDAADQVQKEPMVEPPGQQQRRWYSIVESLVPKDTVEAEEVQRLLSDAVLAAKADDHWANSGILELLNRARDSAVAGFSESARKAAIGLLDFHLVVEKYRMGVSSSSGEEKKCASASSSDANDASHGDAGSAGTGSPRQGDSGQPLSLAADVSDADNTMIYVADTASGGAALNADVDSGRKRRRSIADHIPTEEHPEAAAQLAHDVLTTWSGTVKLQNNAHFCTLTMQVPSSVIDDLPGELKVATIRQRRGIMTKGQVACETEISGANRQQLAQLRKMAQLELVAMMPLEDCGAILVPYLGKSGSIKAVTFLAALEG